MNCHSNWSKINGCMCSLTSGVCHSSALDTDPGDVKARFRRAQAFQKLGRLDQAFLDAQRCAQLEPKNKAFQDLLRQLGAHIQQKVMCFFFYKTDEGHRGLLCIFETVPSLLFSLFTL